MRRPSTAIAGEPEASKKIAEADRPSTSPKGEKEKLRVRRGQEEGKTTP